MTTPVTLAEARERIAADDPRIHAWVRWDPDAVGRDDGPLAHWPIGVKDLLDVRGMPTAAGAISPGAVPEAPADAVAVARLRAAGAAVIGKTAAVEYGWFGTVTTRNPRDPARSPGGSSSGSAAAVAAGMCRVAVGTQTAGSVIRPAAYVGVPAIKLSHGVVDMAGVVPASRTLDALGVFATTVADLTVVTEVLIGEDATPGRPARLAVLDEHFGDLVEPGVRREVERALSALDDAGTEITTVRPGLSWAELARAHRVIMVREIALVHADRFGRDSGHFSASLGAAIAEGLQISDTDYATALAVRSEAKAWFTKPSDGADAWVTPAATSFAPPAGQPGDAACNMPFSLLGLPAVALPTTPPPTGGLAPVSLPTSLQLVGPYGSDSRLLGAAASCEAALTSTPEAADGRR